MNLDRIDPFSAGQVVGTGGQNRPTTQRQDTAAPFAGHFKQSKSDSGDFLAALSLPTAGAVSHSFTKDWAKSSVTYGSHSLAAEAINRVTAPATPAGKKLTAAQKLASQEASKASGMNATLNAAEKSLTYSDIFHLGTQQVPVHKFSMDRLHSTVKSNLSTFTEAVKPKNMGSFFKDTSVKNYFQKTVVQGNFKPAKDLLTNSPDKEIGTGLFRTAAVGLMGYDVVKHTQTAYKQAKAQEDGSIKSKVHTATETVKALGKYTLRDGTSWEAAGAGGAIGKALIPVALGGISMGGILVGALVGVATEKLLDKALKTGEHDPVKQQGNDMTDGKEEGSASTTEGRTGLGKK
jgi:hypothetical protein